MKKILRVPYDQALSCIAPICGQAFPVLRANTIPPGSAILAVHNNYASRSLDFVIQHESFEDTAPGAMLPTINPSWEYVEIVPVDQIIERNEGQD